MSFHVPIIEVGDTVTVQENSAKLAKAYEIIKGTDRELTKEELKHVKEWEAERSEKRKEIRKHDDNKTEKKRREKIKKPKSHRKIAFGFLPLRFFNSFHITH